MILNLLKERLNNYLGLLGVLVFFFFGCKKEGSSNSETKELTITYKAIKDFNKKRCYLT